MAEELDLEGLNPGIRKTVALLNLNGFETCDSGDGKTHEHECDRPGAYVVMQVEPDKLIEESRRLKTILALNGLDVPEMGPGEKDPGIQGTYDPGNDMAFIDLIGVDDELLFDKKTAKEALPS